MAKKLRVFVASSSERKRVADEVASMLNESALLDARVWEREVFKFSWAYIESLEKELDRADFAVVILTADDKGHVRNKAVNLPRDNVIFEFGLFAGRLGRPRCFFFIDKKSETKIATDLSGVKPVEYDRKAKSTRSLSLNLKDQVGKVKEEMLSLDVRYKPSPKVREDQEALWRFSSRFAGEWWERMKKNEDDKSALSYLTITVDEVTNTPQIRGKAFSRSGKALADWETINSGVLLAGRRTVFYRWEGEHEKSRGETYGGGGVIYNLDNNLTSGEGYFYDTNFAQVPQGAPTRVKNFRLFRCDPQDVPVMKKPWTRKAAGLIKSKLETLRWG
jgi:hypothetical protein